jgi:hypothetical protein
VLGFTVVEYVLPPPFDAMVVVSPQVAEVTTGLALWVLSSVLTLQLLAWLRRVRVTPVGVSMDPPLARRWKEELA